MEMWALLRLVVRVTVFLVTAISLSERRGQNSISWTTGFHILRAPCFIYGLFKLSTTLAERIRCLLYLVCRHQRLTHVLAVLYWWEWSALSRNEWTCSRRSRYIFFSPWLLICILNLNTDRRHTNSSSPSSSTCPSNLLVPPFTYIHLRKIPDSGALSQRLSNAHLYRGDTSQPSLEIW